MAAILLFREKRLLLQKVTVLKYPSGYGKNHSIKNTICTMPKH